MQILGKFELFRQTFPPTPIYYDPPNLEFSKICRPHPAIRPPPLQLRPGEYLFSAWFSYFGIVATLSLINDTPFG